ncbi:galactose-3-O-sulfotransferase 2-like [Haliotis rubra]|uniref:galactose-3-O-sulfotransferase 2-like n=1 Tax=Haliotis rubra TaxID=36100 RepID=UPI001EE4FBFF|nr:galactose-3-O-sulfotransferase 2-like [Haliotis rubra]
MAFPVYRTRRLFYLIVTAATVLYVLIMMEAPRHSNNRNWLYAKRRFVHKGSNIPGTGPMSPLDATTHEKHMLQDNHISGHQFNGEQTEDGKERSYAPPRETHSRYSNTTCSPRHNIAFLKVHKSGSTTVSNILQRYAVRNDLNLVLPDKLVGESGFNILGYGPLFSADMVIPVPEGQTFNILCNHMVYNRPVMDQFMPANTFYVAIVRSLEERFMSAMNYFGQVGFIMEEKKGVRGFTLKDVMPHFFINQTVRGINKESLINSIAYDFGFATYRDNEEYFQSYLKNIDKEFDFVMIMEYFDESLVLLRRRLCWGLRDILYIKRNTYEHNSLPLTEEDRHKLYESQKRDHRIYQHFYRKFWRGILAEGHDIFDEVANFKLVQKQVFDFCRGDRIQRKVLNIPSSKWNDEFRLTRSECRQMQMSELMLVEKVMDRARQRLRRDGTEKQWLKYVENFWQRNKMRIRNFETSDEMFYLSKTNAI